MMSTMGKLWEFRAWARVDDGSTLGGAELR